MLDDVAGLPGKDEGVRGVPIYERMKVQIRE